MSGLASTLIVQGRWAWRALPLVALISGAVIWACVGEIRRSDREAREALSRKASEWRMIHAFTGRTLGR